MCLMASQNGYRMVGVPMDATMLAGMALIPYAAEIYPVHLRGTGSGMIAASSKFGGILGAIGGVAGVFNNLGLSALFIAAPMLISAVMLMRSRVDTRERNLEEIQDAVLNRDLMASENQAY